MKNYTENRRRLKDLLKSYAYRKGDTASYSHGQLDMFEKDKHPDINPAGLQSRNVGVCLDGEVIKRDHTWVNRCRGLLSIAEEF